MFKWAYFIVLIGFLNGDDIDELESLYSYGSGFLYKPDSLYKENGLWYELSNENPYTGRVEVYLDQNEFNLNIRSTFESPEIDSSQNHNHMNGSQKIAECTIVDGLKNGYYVQYYTDQLKSPGIAGLYINDKSITFMLTLYIYLIEI